MIRHHVVACLYEMMSYERDFVCSSCSLFGSLSAARTVVFVCVEGDICLCYRLQQRQSHRFVFALDSNCSILLISNIDCVYVNDAR